MGADKLSGFFFVLPLEIVIAFPLHICHFTKILKETYCCQN